jgi:hypothetical protein
MTADALTEYGYKVKGFLGGSAPCLSCAVQNSLCGSTYLRRQIRPCSRMLSNECSSRRYCCRTHSEIPTLRRTGQLSKLHSTPGICLFSRNTVRLKRRQRNHEHTNAS